MNLHFRPRSRGENSDLPPYDTMPSRAYGRIDHVVLPNTDSEFVLIAIDLVDADWLDQAAEQDDRFHLDEYTRTVAWKKYGFQLRDQKRLPSPFEKAPIFRLEIDLAVGDSLFGMHLPLARMDPLFEAGIRGMENEWMEITSFIQAPYGATDAARLYPGLFADPVPVYVKGKLPSHQRGKALSGIFSLASLPRVKTDYVENVLSRAEASMLAVYDVGQGNANALLSDGYQATLYYDLGAGVYGNKDTAPPGLRFCHSANPTVILSHWDADHWAGAYATMANGKYPALSLNWIAPKQDVGPVHTAFAYDITANQGNLFIYEPDANIGFTQMASGHTAKFTVGSGHEGDKNDTGIVLVIENAMLRKGPVSWILPGDCDYRYFHLALSPAPPVGLVAPHHGADLHKKSVPPQPAPTSISTYHRLAYSFGKDNSHGRTGVQHPTTDGTLVHLNAGWSHSPWTPTTPGCPMPVGQPLLATCEHSPGNARDGVLIGWDRRPAPCGVPCSRMPAPGCTAHIGSS